MRSNPTTLWSQLQRSVCFVAHHTERNKNIRAEIVFRREFSSAWASASSTNSIGINTK
jgi:hypothetical protein